MRDLVNLACTSKAHYEVLNKRAFRTIHLYYSEEPVKSRRCALGTRPGDSRSRRLSWPAAEGMVRAWLEDRLVGRAKYLMCQEKRYSKHVSVFRFSGSYPSSAWDQLRIQGGQAPDPWKLQLGDLSALVNLKEYKADVDWRLSDMTKVLELPKSLRSLTIPVEYAEDCGRLAEALANFPRLEALTVLSLPILDEFVDAFPQLGKGIASCASSLRHLVIDLTAHSRPCSWETDDFVLPEPEMDIHFRALFPTPVKADGRDTVFQLKFLGLRHFGIPSDAFQQIFSKEHIEDLCLPDCEVEAELWSDLKGSVSLRSLRNVDYDVVTPEFVDFLSGQKDLETLTFAKPLPTRELLGVASLGEATSRWYQTRIIDTGEPGHQSLADLTKIAFRNLSSLKSLHIPADMYNISRQDLHHLSSALPELERVGLALNYHDLVRRFTLVSCEHQTNLPSGSSIRF